MEKSKILIVDDEADICEMSKAVLEKTGKFDVISSASGIEALALAKKHKPDLILPDIIMSDMDGSIVAEHLLEDPATKHIPVIFVTSLARKTEVRESSGKIGQRLFIAKPVAISELIGRIESVLKVDTQA